MTTTTTTNSHVRRTLASQIDRLDSMLDGLSENLNQAVADAVQGAVELAVRQAVGQAVKEAVQAVLTEVLSNADLLAAVRGLLPVPPSPDAPRTDPPERPRGLLRRACEGVKAGLGAAATACGYLVGKAAGVKGIARPAWQLAKRFRGRVLAACGVGVAAGAVTLWAAPWLGVAAAAAGGFVTTLAVAARNGLRKLFAPTPAFA
jgi:type IV secretory pathway TrbL component